MNIVSGEQFQLLSQISFASTKNCIINDQLKSLNQNVHIIDSFPTSEISKYERIFCYAHDVSYFMEKFLNHLNDNTVIITHNSDKEIDSSFNIFLESPKIKSWYCQNRRTNHPKLHSIPIGIANSQWPHGDQSCITQIRNKNYKKEFLVYKNFDINTNFQERSVCDEITAKNGIVMNPTLSISQYWENLSKSVFVISPPGNGIDCHRIWEALYLRCIPVVKYNRDAFSQFRHLPILFVNDWSEVTINFLEDFSKKYQNNINAFEISMLDINFWKNLIIGKI